MKTRLEEEMERRGSHLYALAAAPFSSKFPVYDRCPEELRADVVKRVKEWLTKDVGDGEGQVYPSLQIDLADEEGKHQWEDHFVFERYELNVMFVGNGWCTFRIATSPGWPDVIGVHVNTFVSNDFFPGSPPPPNYVESESTLAHYAKYGRPEPYDRNAPPETSPGTS